MLLVLLVFVAAWGLSLVALPIGNGVSHAGELSPVALGVQLIHQSWGIIACSSCLATGAAHLARSRLNDGPYTGGSSRWLCRYQISDVSKPHRLRCCSAIRLYDESNVIRRLICPLPQCVCYATAADVTGFTNAEGAALMRQLYTEVRATSPATIDKILYLN
jgi:hypothetical protein